VAYRSFELDTIVKVYVTAVHADFDLYDFAAIPVEHDFEDDDIDYLSRRMAKVMELGKPVPEIKPNLVVLAKNDEGDDEKGTDLSRFSTSALLFVFN
jgi:hypothetical protein